MTNQIAISLGVLILVGMGVDMFMNEGEGLLFLMRKLAELIEWLAFWR